jgi:hypothetical protein
MSARILVAVLLVSAAGCGDSPTSPSSVTSSTVSTAGYYDFEATLSSGESAFDAFNVSTAGAVTVTLSSIIRPPQYSAVPVRLRIGVGIPQGEGCNISESVDAVPALTPQLTSTLGTGIHCVSVADIGDVAGTVLVAVRVTHT